MILSTVPIEALLIFFLPNLSLDITSQNFGEHLAAILAIYSVLDRYLFANLPFANGKKWPKNKRLFTKTALLFEATLGNAVVPLAKFEKQKKSKRC